MTSSPRRDLGSYADDEASIVWRGSSGKLFDEWRVQTGSIVLAAGARRRLRFRRSKGLLGSLAELSYEVRDAGGRCDGLILGPQTSGEDGIVTVTSGDGTRQSVAIGPLVRDPARFFGYPITDAGEVLGWLDSSMNVIVDARHRRVTTIRQRWYSSRYILVGQLEDPWLIAAIVAALCRHLFEPADVD